MANKFTKSVMERLEQETKKNTKPIKAADVEVPQVKEKQPVKPTVTQENPKKAAIKEEIQPDLGSFLRIEKGRTAKNKTFYLDEEVVDALHKAAVGQKVTDSKLVNDILRKVLGLN